MGSESRLLYDEKPLVVIPELAKVVGLNEALVLQQIHYWVKLNQRAEKNFKEDHFWTYNTYLEWQEQFPFWSLSTIKRTIRKLEISGLVISDTFNRLPIDRTKWYRLDYDKISDCVKVTPSMGHNELAKVSKRPVQHSKLNLPLPEITTKINADTIIDIWTTTLNNIKEQVSKANYRTWLADIVPLSYDNGTFVLGVKNEFVREYLMKNQISLLESHLIKVIGKPVKVICTVKVI